MVGLTGHMFEEEGNGHIGECLMGQAWEFELYSVGNSHHRRLWAGKRYAYISV